MKNLLPLSRNSQLKSFVNLVFIFAILLGSFFVFGSGARANSASDYWKTYFSTEELKAVQKNAQKYTLAQIDDKSKNWHNILTGFNIKNGSITDDNIKKNEIATNKIKGLGDFIDAKISGSSTPQDFSADKLTGTYAALDGSQITGITASQVGAVPYTGAASNVDLGSRTLTTTGTGTFGNIKTPIISPATDSTSAFQINKADGTTNVLNVDTTNNIVKASSISLTKDFLLSPSGVAGSNVPHLMWLGSNQITYPDADIDGIASPYYYSFVNTSSQRLIANIDTVSQLYLHPMITDDGNNRTLDSAKALYIQSIDKYGTLTINNTYGIFVNRPSSGTHNYGMWSYAPIAANDGFIIAPASTSIESSTAAFLHLNGTTLDLIKKDNSGYFPFKAGDITSTGNLSISGNLSLAGGNTTIGSILNFNTPTASTVKLVQSGGTQLQVTKGDGSGYLNFLAMQYTGNSIKPFSDTTNAFQIRKADGASNVLDVDTLNGMVGIGTTTPAAALDVNGQVKIQKSSSQPFACDATHDGTIALTSGYRTCVCKGGSTTWVFTTDGTTTCTW